MVRSFVLLCFLSLFLPLVLEGAASTNDTSVSKLTSLQSDRNTFEEDSENSSPEQLEQLLNSYASHNSLSALEKDSNICSRQFIVGHYSCRQLGKKITSYLSLMSSAVIKNETFIWSYCDENGCHNNTSNCALLVQPWVPSVWDVQARLKSFGCIDNAVKIASMQAPDFYSSTTNSTLTSSGNYSAEDKSRESILYMYGSEAAHGALFRSAFLFGTSVKKLTEQILDTSAVISGFGRDRAFVVGIHARHATNNSLDTGFVKYAEEKECIKHIIANSKPKFGERYCVIVLSTDRNHTLVGLSNFANSIGCELINAKETKKRNRIFADNGLPILSDLLLLSDSDVFIGSTTQVGDKFRSYFSSLVANLVAIKHRGADDIIWLPDQYCKYNATEGINNEKSVSEVMRASEGPYCPQHILDLNNKAIKSGSSKSVFLVQNCTRHEFPDWDTFLTFNISASQILFLTDDKLKAIEKGKGVRSIYSQN